MLQNSASHHDPLVSIVTGTYNSMPYLQTLLQSYQAQSVSDWEVIFVDDGSKDGTVAALKKICQEDQRFRLIEKPAEGFPSRSRNVGLQAARGKWIAFCDHDDFWAPDKLAIQLAALKAHPKASICHTDRIVWRSSDIPTELPRFKVDASLWEIQKPRDVLLKGQRIIFSSFITSRPLLLKVGGLHPDLRGVDDFYLFLKLSLEGEILHIRQNLTFYFEHDSNLSHTPNIFIEGLYKVHAIAQAENLPKSVVQAVYAQALKSKGVSLLASQPFAAAKYFGQSLSAYPMPRTLALLALSLVFCIIPVAISRSFTTRLRAFKARYPSPADLWRRSSPGRPRG